MPPVAIARIIEKERSRTIATKLALPDRMLSIKEVPKAAGIANKLPAQFATSNRTQPPASISTVIEQDFSFACASEVTYPNRMLPIEQITKTAGIAKKLPAQLAAGDRTQPPVAVSAVLKQNFSEARAREVAHPYRM